MFSMDFDITIGSYRLAMLESVVVTRSVENLVGTATVTLPAAACGRTPEFESKIREGDAVCIRFGYDARMHGLPVEFEGYVAGIAADDGEVRIECEDGMRLFRRELRNAALGPVSVKRLLEHVVAELGGFDLACDYDFEYDRFTVCGATGFDVLKKVQEDTRACIYLKGTTLHVHPQYAEIGREVICDFAVNIEESELKYKDARERKVAVAVEGTDACGRTVRVVKGTPGGDKFTVRLPGVSDRATLERRAEEELKIRACSGYEGSFTGWLFPRIEPTDVVELRNAGDGRGTGKYYAVSVETTFAATGGSRKVTIGKRIG